MKNDSPRVASNQFTRVDLKATGETDASVLADLLRQTFAAIDEMALPPDDKTEGPVIGFRATAPNTSLLIAEVVNAAMAESDAQNVRVLAVDIAGIMPADDGIRCWGYLAVADRASERPAFTISGTPIFTHEGKIARGELALQIERVDK